MIRQQTRPARGRNGCLTVGCGCLSVVLVVGVVGVGLLLFAPQVVSPLLAPVVAQTTGLQEVGSDDEVFADNPTPQPTPQLLNATTPQTLDFNVPGRTSGSVDVGSAPLEVQVGEDTNGQRVALVTATEDDLLALCQQRSTVCSPEGNGTVRNGSIDLRPGGAIAYVEARVPLFGQQSWQRVGVVMEVAADGQRFEAVGLEFGGRVFAVGPEANNELRAQLDEAERLLNETVQQLSVSADGTPFTLQNVTVTDDAITAELR